MFGLGWTEVLIIALAAFLFLKPEDLPKAMRQIGVLVGKIRAYMNSITKDIDILGEEDADDPAERTEGTPAAGRRRKGS